MKLEEFLAEYNDKGIYPMHMPGHKRNTELISMVNPYSIDVTEAGELDNMHKPEGIIAECIEKCSKVFGSSTSYYLINGSTCGILAGISAAVKKGGRILLSRACHKSVYNAVYLRELEPVYIYPDFDEEFGIYGSISPESVESSLKKYSDIELVIITSPTYEGIVSDIGSISRICHKFNVPLMVDSAHGAHFGFYEAFPKKSISLGADISVESIHKTLPAFTQTSLLHYRSSLVSENKLKGFLTLYQTTSPSYILMCGIDNCVEFLESEVGKLAFSEYIDNLNDFSDEIKALKNIKILCKGEDKIENHPLFFDIDIGKIVISVKNTGLTGADLEEILLKDYKIQLEMALGDYGLAMTSVCDTKEGIERLKNALIEIDDRISAGEFKKNDSFEYSNRSMGIFDGKIFENSVVMKPSDAIDALGRKISSKESSGFISQEYVFAYPPGIPLIVPGEMINQDILDFINSLEKLGTAIYSTSNEWSKFINVVQTVDE